MGVFLKAEVKCDFPECPTQVDGLLRCDGGAEFTLVTDLAWQVVNSPSPQRVYCYCPKHRSCVDGPSGPA